MSKQKLKLLILLNLTWSILGFFADFAWLREVPIYLVPLTSICSLYPPLLTIWYLLKYLDRLTPNWLTFWVILGTASYGLMAQIYFPLLMSWKGINFHDVGSMFWVAVYGLQSIILFKHLKKLSFQQMLPGLIYIFTADSSHFFYPTFVDFILPNYPIWLKITTVSVAVLLQISVAAIVYLLNRNHRLVLN